MDAPKSYVYVIERADDGFYWAYLPDLPGCVTSAETAEEVEKQLPEAVGLYLSYFNERALPPPAPQAGAALVCGSKVLPTLPVLGDRVG